MVGHLLCYCSLFILWICICTHTHTLPCAQMQRVRCRLSLSRRHTHSDSRGNGLTSESEQSEDFVPLLLSAIRSPQTALHVSIMSQVYPNKSADLSCSCSESNSSLSRPVFKLGGIELEGPKKSPAMVLATFSARASSDDLSS